MAKKQGGLSRGVLVYKRRDWGDAQGSVDEENLYRIRSIGSKQCTIERIDKNTLEPLYNRGHNIYLSTKEEAEINNNPPNGQRRWSTKYWDWSQYLVPIGNAGWDPDINY